MPALLGAFALTLSSLVSIMNPLAALPVFAAMTTDEDPGGRARTARRTAIAVAVVAVLSATVGRYLLQGLGIGVAELQVAGGIVVGASGLTMVTGNAARLSPQENAEGKGRSDPSVVPLAIPLISGPGAIGVLVALSSREPLLFGLVGVLLACLVMAAATFVVLRFGDPLVERLGTTGIGVLTRVFGLVILAVAIELMREGTVGMFPVLAR